MFLSKKYFFLLIFFFVKIECQDFYFDSLVSLKKYYHLDKPNFPIRNLGYCKDNYCFGIPKINISNEYSLLCVNLNYLGIVIDLSILYGCFELGFDDFIPIYFIIGLPKFLVKYMFFYVL